MAGFYRSRGAAIRGFFKDNIVYIILGITVIACIAYGIFSGYLNKKITSSSDPNQNPQLDNEDNDMKNAGIDVNDIEIELSDDERSYISEDENVPSVLIYSPPVENGNISMDYSGVNAVYSKTLDDWRTHPGIDYKTENNEPVYAVADGIVKKVYSDGVMGMTVVIAHSDGCESIYQSLAESIKVSKDDKVKAGQIIAYTGNTASAEIEQGNHLHFAIKLNGKYIDPKDKYKSLS